MDIVGASILLDTPHGTEQWAFASEEEAQARLAFVEEGLSWIGTPFRDCAAVKGREGAVDCAMLLTAAAINSKLLEPFDPRPYEPRWHMHHADEQFLGWVGEKLGGIEVPEPRFGDVIVWHFGRCFSHGGIIINTEEVVHAYAGARCVLVSRLDEAPLRFIGYRSKHIPRPVKYFDVWQGRNI